MGFEMPLTAQQLEHARTALQEATVELSRTISDQQICESHITKLENMLQAARSVRKRSQISELQEQIGEARSWLPWIAREIRTLQRKVETKQQFLDTNGARLPTLAKAQVVESTPVGAPIPVFFATRSGSKTTSRPKIISKRSVMVRCSHGDPRAGKPTRTASQKKSGAFPGVAASDEHTVQCEGALASEVAAESHSTKLLHSTTEADCKSPKKRKLSQDEEALGAKRPAKKVRRSYEATTSADKPKAAGVVSQSAGKKRKACQVEEPRDERLAKKARTSPDAQSRKSSKSTSPSAGVEIANDCERHGLLNLSNACFSNAALQMLSSALSHEEIVMLRGQGSNLDSFGFVYQDFHWKSYPASNRKEHRTNVSKLTKLRKNICKAAKADGCLKVAPYLGQLLLDMRGDGNEKSEEGNKQDFRSPIFLQQVFAYGDGDNSTRVQYDGDDQQDSMEYLSAIIDILAGEGHQFVREKFAINRATSFECEACGDESKKDETSDTAITVRGYTEASASKKGASQTETLDLRSLLESNANESERPEGIKCENCGCSTLARRPR